MLGSVALAFISGTVECAPVYFISICYIYYLLSPTSLEFVGPTLTWQGLLPSTDLSSAARSVYDRKAISVFECLDKLPNYI